MICLWVCLVGWSVAEVSCSGAGLVRSGAAALGAQERFLRQGMPGQQRDLPGAGRSRGDADEAWALPE